MGFIVHPHARGHGITDQEIEEALENRSGPILGDPRAEHQNKNPKYWFVSETNQGKKLKIVFVEDPDFDEIVIITAYEPSKKAIEYYGQASRKIQPRD